MLPALIISFLTIILHVKASKLIISQEYKLHNKRLKENIVHKDDGCLWFKNKYITQKIRSKIK